MKIGQTDSKYGSYGAFGEQIVAEPTPIIQKSFVYGEPQDWEKLSATGGSVTFSDNLSVCQTGTSVGGYGVSRSNRALIYRAGEGNEFRFTGMFTEGVANSLQLAGALNLTDAIGFGYNGTEFGVLHEYGGRAEIQVLTVSAGASGTESITVTIADDDYTFNVTAGTAGHNGYEIQQYLEANVPGWRFESIGATVSCQSETASTKVNNFALVNNSAGTCAGTFAQITAGQATTKNWTAMGDWNIYNLGCDQYTRFTLDPTKLNVYKIEFGYLGSAGIRYYVLNPTWSQWVLVHVERFANLNTETLFFSPSLKPGWVSASLGSTTNLSVKGASCAAFAQGKRVITGRPRALTTSTTGLGNTETNVATIKTKMVFGDKPNQSEIQPFSISASTDSTKGGTFNVYINTTVTGAEEYTDYGTESIAIYNETSGGITGGIEIASGTIGDAGGVKIELPNEYLTAVDSISLTYTSNATGSPSDTVNAAISWYEIK